MATIRRTTKLGKGTYLTTSSKVDDALLAVFWLVALPFKLMWWIAKSIYNLIVMLINRIRKAYKKEGTE